jgi:uncharacterized OB-fold protein
MNAAKEASQAPTPPGAADPATRPTAPEPQRPLPDLSDPATARAWQGFAAHEFTYPVCDSCGEVVWYPRSHCPGCGSLSLTWHTAPAPVQGTIYTCTVVRRHTHPFFATRTPYVVAWIDLDAGPRLLSEVVTADPASITIGDRVTLTWEDDDQVALPLFTPAP